MLAAPVVVLTTIGLEQAEVLGATRELIFAEKAAVIAPGAEVVFGPLEGLEAAAAQVCADRRARAHFLGRDVVVAGVPASFSVELEGERFGALAVPTPAFFQTVNAGLAVAACRLLTGGLDAGAVRRALAGTTVPGRLQIAGREPLVVADGAHNPHGVTALIEALAGLPRGAPRGGLRHHGRQSRRRDARPLLPLVETVVCTQASESRSLSTAPSPAAPERAARGRLANRARMESEQGVEGAERGAVYEEPILWPRSPWRGAWPAAGSVLIAGSLTDEPICRSLAGG